VLDQLNEERASQGRQALPMNTKLIHSAHAHNLRMATANNLSHQLPGEAALGNRVTAAGFHWTWCGENIGWNSQQTLGGVLALETGMFGEQPPNDGHRQNILSTSATSVGIDVIVDSVHHKVWLTEDFGKGS
jgi:uncharacterized protein YkwD